MKIPALMSAFALLGAAGSADALTFQCRFVERIGNVDSILQNNTIDADNEQLRNIRLQFAVVDDSEPAAAGGFIGWSAGSIIVNNSESNSDERRNGPGPGRITPFNSSSDPNANGNPPLPGGDPFTMLTDIDATIDTQSPTWVCDAQGNVPAQPPAVVRGRNFSFVSIFAFSTDPSPGAQSYTITVSGNLIAATAWQIIGTPTPPNCGNSTDPTDDVPGSVTYAPVPTAPQPFTCVLSVRVIPAPGAAVFLGLAGLLAMRRTRRLR